MKHLILKFSVLAFILMGGGIISLNAQQIKGNVKDATGPLAGIAVIVQGTTNGTATDYEGNFVLNNVPSDATLEVSSIGYETQVIPVDGKTFFNVLLVEDALALEETVVVGYGIQKKSVVSAAISSVSAEDLAREAPLRVDQALKGLTSGVTVTSSSGQPGASAKVTIRGTGTINNSDPLYIVDGMPIEGGIDYLNPQDIESIEVLKDAASGAVYGARAANGVILITTKKGKEGKARVSYDFSYGISSPWRERSVLNATEYAIMQNEGRINAGMAPIYADPYSYGEGTNWQKEVFNYNAPSQKHELSVSGGSEKVTYYVSAGYTSQEGIVGGNFDRSNYKRLTLRANNTYKVMDKSEERNFLHKFNLTTNLSYAYIKSKGVETNSQWGSPLGSALALSPILGVVASEAQAAEYASLYDGFELLKNKAGQVYMIPGTDYNEIVNPVASMSLPGNDNWSHKVVGGLSAELYIWDRLRFKTQVSADLSFWGYNGYTPLFYLGSNNKATDTKAYSESCRSLVWQVENTLMYDKTIGDHSFAVLLGQSAKSSSGQYLGGGRLDMKSYDRPYIDYCDGLQEDGRQYVYGAPYAQARLASYFFRGSYNYAERYMAEVTVRHDGSSRFGYNNHWATFPSVSAGWNIHKEKWMGLTPASALSRMKLRASWGMNGNENIGNFGYTVLTSSGQNAIFGTPATGESISTGVKPSGLANQSLRWETSRQTDIALDFGFFQNALTVTVDWYSKVTDGMLMTMNIPSYVGENKPTGNVGIMNNMGVELEIGYKLVKGDFTFNVNANATYLKNKLIEYGNVNGWDNLDSFQGAGTITRAQNGLPFPYFYGLKTNGVFQNMDEVNAYVGENGLPIQPSAVPGDVRFVDVNGDGQITDDDRTYIGKGTPDVTYGLNLNFGWKGLELSILFQGTAGNQVFDATRRSDISTSNLPAYMLNRWTGEGTSNRLPRYVRGDSVNWKSSDLYVFDGSYARLKNVRLSYTLPEKITRKALISTLRFYVAAENLATITSYHGYDPEISSGGRSLGVDYGVYPQARTFTFGVNLAF